MLVTELADEANRGKTMSLDEACKLHPKFETELRELWGTIIVTDAAAKEQGSSFLQSSDVAAPQLELPCDFGNYILEEEIGRGGMGIVYRAVRTSNEEPVAIKMILKGDFATEADRQRFETEAYAAAKLDHPNIIPIYEIGEIQGRSFFCMKLIEGQSLSERLTRGPMPPARAARIMDQVSDAIEYAHQQGVLHRDLKPSNIMLDSSSNAYIADFGLAKQAQQDRISLTRSGAILGTPSYMSPEQAAGERGQVGVTSDVYSLGAVLYNMITGRPPFLGSSPVETVLMVLEQDPVAPRILNRRADRRLEMIAMRCLQKPQDLRYSSAKLLNEDIKAFLRNDSMAASEGRFGQIIGNLFRETHHAVVLENWGLIWMWHSLVLLVASLATNILFIYGNNNRLHYWLMWTFGLSAWAVVFWLFRRKLGPVTFVERQIAHVWAAAMCVVAFLFPLEASLGLEVLSLAPLLAVTAGMVFLVKAGILSGSFYIQSAALFLTAIVMALFPPAALTLFGFVSGACFFFAGLKYYRRRKTQKSHR